MGNLSFGLRALRNPGLVNVTTLVEQTKKYASSGMIDFTRNMTNDRIFVYHGANDTTVFPGHTPLFNIQIVFVCFIS